MRQRLKLCGAFLAGILIAALIAMEWTAALRKENAQLRDDLEWAIQRGVTAEAWLILCRKGVK